MTNNDSSFRDEAIDAWVDTGFTGDLVIPRSIVEKLILHQTGTVDSVLIDGTQVLLAIYHFEIEWFGNERLKRECARSANRVHFLIFALVVD